MGDHITADDAIASALKQDWEEAIRINSELIKKNKNDVDAHNRLGYAYMMSGHISSSRQNFEKVMLLDPYNKIASRNLKKLSTVKQKDLLNAPVTHLSPLMFLEEPGRTKVVPCINVAPANQLSSLYNGQELFLKPKKHSVEIRDTNNAYLGALPDDLSFKLIKYIEGGNVYKVFLKTVGKNTLTVFLREVTRGKFFINQPSFISPSVYTGYSKADDVNQDRPDMTQTGEDGPDPDPQEPQQDEVT